MCCQREKGYIDLDFVDSHISYFFEVPKGLTDIQMVYNGTKSGLNDILWALWFILWAPWFPLPTIGSDVGEMFLNFSGPD